MSAIDELALNGGQVLIQQTDDTQVVLPSSTPKMGTGVIIKVSYSDHKYNVDQNVSFLVSEASFFKDVETGDTYAILDEKFVYFSYEIPIPPP